MASRAPDKILQLAVDPATGIEPFHGRRIAFELGLGPAEVKAMVALASALYRAFTEIDASILEINPLVVTGSGGLVALDAKIGFDDNALFRHPEIEALRDEDEEDPIEREGVCIWRRTRRGLIGSCRARRQRAAPLSPATGQAAR